MGSPKHGTKLLGLLFRVTDQAYSKSLQVDYGLIRHTWVDEQLRMS